MRILEKVCHFPPYYTIGESGRKLREGDARAYLENECKLSPEDAGRVLSAAKDNYYVTTDVEGDKVFRPVRIWDVLDGTHRNVRTYVPNPGEYDYIETKESYTLAFYRRTGMGEYRFIRTLDSAYDSVEKARNFAIRFLQWGENDTMYAVHLVKVAEKKEFALSERIWWLNE